MEWGGQEIKDFYQKEGLIHVVASCKRQNSVWRIFTSEVLPLQDLDIFSFKSKS